MATTGVTVSVPGNHLMVELLGQRDELLRLVEAAFPDVRVHVRGNEITLVGEQADAVARTFTELVRLVQAGHRLEAGSVRRAIEMVRRDESPTEILGAEVLRAHGGRVVRPKSSGQKRYVDAIRHNVITFGVGPAGTGKSWLAVACAVQALNDKQVDRIILTRPAVEAGERLGFLPGDLMAKVDPYLRPLYDALHDMVGLEGAAKLLERGVVEVAPLAFMRGRSQPVGRRVLTPTGWRAIGDLEVGDLVVGADGHPTPVLGVFPQGPQEVFTVRADDGAETVASGDHLWAVRTAPDLPWKVLSTRELAADLGPRHRRHYELPLVAPVVLCRLDVDNRRQVDKERQGTVEERVALLKDLVDASGGDGAIRFTSASARRRDGVVALVRSLGGVAHALGPDVLDIRLPESVVPGTARPARFVDGIEPAGEADCVCIRVAAADSLYVTEDFLVTHNTLNSSFIICDEAQNTTPEQMKMFLTRIGFGSKAVVTGDVTQVDVPGGRSGLLGLEAVLEGIEGLSWIWLSSGDVVRHRIVQDIVDAYERAAVSGERRA